MSIIQESSYLHVFSKHRYVVSSRPENSELSKHLSEGHNLSEDLKILQDQNQCVKFMNTQSMYCLLFVNVT